ncbi:MULTISPECIES: 4-oxalocrotonate tautomerase [unclassified Polynucleobacter]|uniref:4-oxalocrotonate tautomerase n=1 Tax=unclassified Polynucleobacter TaxID=2640945 RepID=UPI0008D2BA72|nr:MULTISPECIES: 4-oxalocrotonate tautomerase [unclassified Polynucleobacter]OHC09422.1 MAG: 4-oxalocrotonate tautomerase [Polynucleobacter sp. GWA2_45_21]HBK43092.1 4-oxalocrotonate tautomerase [Polynucleobacter sp.]
MPIIQIQLFEGRSADVKREYAIAITKAAVKIMGCSADSVDVIYQDVKKSDWATAGKLWNEQS